VTRGLRLCWCLLGLLPLAAQAGRTCEQHPLDAKAVSQAIELAQQVQAELERSQAQAVIVARIGSDLSRYGLRYTHAGLAYRDGGEGAGWTILHKLNHCESDRAELFEQGLANFFLDDPYEYRALVLTPVPGLQDRLVEAARAGRGQLVDEARYSLIAYPFASESQNSNGWLLEFIALAEAGAAVTSRSAAQDHLRRTAYRPSTIGIDPWQRLGAALFRANVIFTDHPLKERLSGRYSIVSVESIGRYLSERGLLLASRELVWP
jgi:hypothetical protein